MRTKIRKWMVVVVIGLALLNILACTDWDDMDRGWMTQTVEAALTSTNGGR